VLQFLHVASLSYSFASFNASLPSSHASSSFSSIAALEKLRVFNYVWILLAVITSLGRLYEGVHYLSDVLAGALLGYFVTYLVFYFDKRYGWSRKWRMA
jgi:undecaprenyl-diphosphatase